MRDNEKEAPPGIDQGALPKPNIVSLPSAQKVGNPNQRRMRYIRLFPDRFFLVTQTLEPIEVVAYLKLAAHFVLADGDLPADDKALAALTGAGKRWPALRDKLLALQLGRINAGRWIDDHQLSSLELQQRATQRGQSGAAGRWGGRNA